MPEALRGDLDRVAGRIAKGWLLELVDAAPLNLAPDIAAADLAVEGPVLARAMIEAAALDSELERLRSVGDLLWLASRAGELAGAANAAEIVAAVDVLREVALTELLGGLRRDEGELAAEVAARLAHVGAVVAQAALARERADAVPAVPDRLGDEHPQPASQVPTERQPPPEAGLGPDDELARVRAERLAVTDSDRERAPWRDALDGLSRQRSAAGQRLVLLLVEVDGRERLVASEPDGAVTVLEHAGRALREHLRNADVLVHEEAGRNWVIAPDIGRAGGLVLAERLAATVGWAASLRGVPLTASVGIAVFPEDGRDADAMASSAEESLFAARASGLPVAGGVPADGDDGG